MDDGVALKMLKGKAAGCGCCSKLHCKASSPNFLLPGLLPQAPILLVLPSALAGIQPFQILGLGEQVSGVKQGSPGPCCLASKSR